MTGDRIAFDRWTYGAEVLAVHDGDTITARVDLGFSTFTVQRLRLLGIQAPEVAGPNVSAEERAAGLVAKGALSAMLAAGAVFVKTKAIGGRDGEDGRGRYLALVFVQGQGGAILQANAQLIARGLATPYDGEGKAPKWTPNGWTRAA